MRLRSAVVVVVLMLCSCNQDRRPPVFPVQGKVFADKKPAAGAVVWFHPTPPDASMGFPKPHGTVDNDGVFHVGTYADADGAPAGKYKVSVIWRVPSKSGGDEDGANLIPLRYMDPEKAGLPLVEVSPEPNLPNVLPPFEISRKK